MKKNVLFSLCLVTLLPMAGGQLDINRESIKWERIRKIDFHHISVGIEFGGNKNKMVTTIVSTGVGTHRNLINIDGGLKYSIINPISFGRQERVSLHQFPIFVFAKMNILRQKNHSVFIGAEYEYAFSLTSKHHIEDSYTKDDHLGHNCSMVAVKIGVRLEKIEFGIGGKYRLAPAFNQKYVYESVDYDYSYLKESIFEHFFANLNIIYHFNF